MAPVPSREALIFPPPPVPFPFHSGAQGVAARKRAVLFDRRYWTSETPWRFIERNRGVRCKWYSDSAWTQGAGEGHPLSAGRALHQVPKFPRTVEGDQEGPATIP